MKTFYQRQWQQFEIMVPKSDDAQEYLAFLKKRSQNDKYEPLHIPLREVLFGNISVSTARVEVLPITLRTIPLVFS
jgi:hypothetical protein